MDNTVHLVKLCVGADSPEALEAWRANRRASEPDYVCRHVTRMWPKRADDLLNGGSLYWVFRGLILARQRVIRLDEVIGQDGIRRCGIVMAEQLVRTEAVPRRPFQGWRYLAPSDAPRDLSVDRPNDSALPADLKAALAEIGVR